MFNINRIKDFSEDQNKFLSNDLLRQWNVLGKDETLEDAFKRVSESVSLFDDDYPNGDSKKFENEMMQQLQAKKIIPSTPILMNAGRFNDVPLSACAVPPINLRDDLSKIKTKVDELHFEGMGTGFNFDETEDPISSIKYLNQVSIDGQNNEKQLRPVGNIGIMSLNNPKIIEFINLKNNAEKNNENWGFNLSVDLNRKQINQILGNGEIELDNNDKISTMKILDSIAKSIWLSGDPGLIFMDRVREDNTVPSTGELVSMAPCGEIGLARGETCQFSYINLGKFVNNGEVNYNELKKTINSSIHFLDNVVDYNIKNSSDPSGALMAKNKRRIGLGVCGFDDMLKAMSLEYDSEEAVKLAENLFSFINYESKITSVELAKERGPFNMFNESQFVIGHNHLMERLAAEETETVSQKDWLNLIKNIKESGIRHCSTIALPPTGRSSRIVFASQSIEPSLEDTLKIDGYKQIKMVSAIQKFVDESISKTINVKNKTSVEDIKQLLIASMKSNLKGITIYRDGSRSNQPKNFKNK